MNTQDRAEFLRALAGLDGSIDFVTLEAGKDDDAYDTQTAPLVGQIGNAAKAVLLLANLILELNQPPAPPVLCVCCDAPATLALGNWDVCALHYNVLTEPDPAEGEALWP